MQPINKIVAFGDSFIYGDELLPTGKDITPQGIRYRNSYGAVGQLAALLGDNVTVENYGIMGNSLQGIMWTFMHYMQEHNTIDLSVSDTLILVGLTAPDRQSFWDAHNMFSNPYYSKTKNLSYVNDIQFRHGTNPTTFSRMTKDHLGVCVCDELASIQSYTFTHAIFSYCKTYNLRLLMVPINDQYKPVSGYPADIFAITANQYLHAHPENNSSWWLPRGHWSTKGSTYVAKYWFDLITRHNI